MRLFVLAAVLVAVCFSGCRDVETQQPTVSVLEPEPIVAPVPSAVKALGPTTVPAPSIIAVPAVPPPIPNPAPTPKKPLGIGGGSIVRLAEKYVGMNEKLGNRGAQIDEWNMAAGVPLGSPYCGSFAGAMHTAAGFTPPKGYAFTPNWFLSAGGHRIEWAEVREGDVIGFFYGNLGRIGHIAIMKKFGHPYTATVEANTSFDARAGSASDREGDGVHAKLRNTKILTQGKNRVARYW